MKSEYQKNDNDLIDMFKKLNVKKNISDDLVDIFKNIKI